MQVLANQDRGYYSNYTEEESTFPTLNRLFSILTLGITLSASLAALCISSHGVAIINASLVGLLALLLAFASYTDLTTTRIPNQLTYASIMASVLLVSLRSIILVSHHGWASPESLVDSLMGAIVCGAIAFGGWLAKTVGGGDVKLVFAVGLVLGLSQTIEAVVAAHCFAVLFLVVKYLPTGLSRRNWAKQANAATDHVGAAVVGVPMAGFYASGVVAAWWCDLL